MTFYKVVWPWGESLYGKSTWDLPKNGKPGEWMPEIKGRLIRCKNGYHGCTKEQLPLWEKKFTKTYVMETKGETIIESRQVITRQARLHELMK